MNYRIILVLISFLVVSKLKAYQIITGVVIEDNTESFIDIATIELLKLPDSTSVKGVISGTNGEFYFYDIDNEYNYCLRISHLNYNTKTVKVNHDTTNIINNVGIIYLKPKVLSLNEIVVSGKKIAAKEMLDRTVYDIPVNAKKIAVDGLDFLRQLPSVQIDYFTESISIEGKRNIIIEVDGIRRNQEYLKKLHPSQIDKIELIHSPSGKYDPETDMVVNIISNSKIEYGLSGKVNAKLLPNNTNNYLARLGFNIDVGKEKLLLYLYGNTGADKYLFNSNLYRNVGNSVAEIDGSKLNNGTNRDINTGIQYKINKKSILDLSLSYLNHTQKVKEINYNLLSESEIYTEIYTSNKNLNTEKENIGSNLYFKHFFDDAKEHSIEYTFNYNVDHTNNLNKNQNSFYIFNETADSSTTLLSEENNTESKTIGTQVNHILPLSPTLKFNSGLNFDYNNYSVDNRISLSNSQNLQYLRQLGALYFELYKKFSHIDFKIGSRIEKTFITIDNNQNNNYLSFLPYSFIQHKINNKNSIQLTYKRRVFNPKIEDLNPFESVIDSLTIKKGNINLRPAYRDKLQLKYSLTYGKNNFTGSFMPGLFFEYQTGIIQKITRPIDNSNTVEIMPVNLSNGFETGAGISLYSQIYKSIINAYFSYYFQHTDQYQDQVNAINNIGWRCRTSIMYPLPKDFKVFAMINLPGPYANGQKIEFKSPFYLFGIMKQFKNNSAIKIMMFNPLSNEMFRSKYTINNSDLFEVSNSYMKMKNIVLFNYSKTFKTGKKLSKNTDKATPDEKDNISMPFNYQE